MIQNLRECARVLLALIRLINGLIGLFVPHMIIRRFNEEGEDPPVAKYALRMFGIRTILVALDLLKRPGPDRSHAIRMAPIIHASDAITAFVAARSGLVPRKTGTLIVAISAFNTLLALAMQGGSKDPE